MPKRPRRSISDVADYSDGGDDSGDEDYVVENDVLEDDFKIARDDGVGAAARRRKKGQFSKGGLKKNGFYDAVSYDSTVYQDYSQELTLKTDHMKRPIWVTGQNLIILEAFSEFYDKAYDFLIDIAEPETRPEFVHTYRLTRDSLYASSITKSTDYIIRQLNIFCKTDLPGSVVQYIKDCTQTFGKAKLVLKDNKFFVESQFPEVLKELLRNPTIRDSRALESPPIQPGGGGGLTLKLSIGGKGGKGDGGEAGFVESEVAREDRRNTEYARIDGNDDDDDDDDDDPVGDGSGKRGSIKTVSFQIMQNRVQLVKKCAKEESFYPLLEEYDFKADLRNPRIAIDLRPSTQIRPYQERSLNKMFGNGRARSGIIVLPCGAGKSLTGVVAATTIKRSTMVMCINNASVKQWKEQFVLWTTVNPDSVKLFTSTNKDSLPQKNAPCIIITTYAMACHGGKRSESSELMMDAIRKREWGLIILDEVHVAPAEMFRKVLDMCNAHCKLGLTATLVREDEKIKDLHFLVGPKLYEANWIDLTNQGYLARAQCVEVWCPMTKEFYSEYIDCGMGSHSRTQKLLYLLNPRKVRVCEYLVREHMRRGHKIIIFSDDVPALKLYCTGLIESQINCPYIYGETKSDERNKWLQIFKQAGSGCDVIGLSQVGDTALDIPEANVVIQVSSHFGSKRQEAQRLGRILRPKPNPTGGFNAFFYTLVSTDTKEMYFSMKRQQYLIDQGYTFKIDQKLVERAEKDSMVLPIANKDREMNLLNQVLKFSCDADDERETRALSKEATGEYDSDGGEGARAPAADKGGAVRRTGQLSALSGADGTVYMEYDYNE